MENLSMTRRDRKCLECGLIKDKSFEFTSDAWRCNACLQARGSTPAENRFGSFRSSISAHSEAPSLQNQSERLKPPGLRFASPGNSPRTEKDVFKFSDWSVSTDAPPEIRPTLSTTNQGKERTPYFAETPQELGNSGKERENGNYSGTFTDEVDPDSAFKPTSDNQSLTSSFATKDPTEEDQEIQRLQTALDSAKREVDRLQTMVWGQERTMWICFCICLGISASIYAV
eukprot:NODE_4158_length_833_cov_31.750708_g4000_i0.p1 GENE.NODE_4158_length_833_cov_31.750708_g4000_i0~~NODE_4158_length_833_cov_31.750708_g4000_i0.p1  ORF type:complete len:229 (+),score=38.66 NODE_4158_length_833_cov_31.750708_g4000_i0:59-745(+)